MFNEVIAVIKEEGSPYTVGSQGTIDWHWGANPLSSPAQTVEITFRNERVYLADYDEEVITSFASAADLRAYINGDF